METTLGLRMFERTGTGINLTSTGGEVLKMAEAFVDDFNALTKGGGKAGGQNLGVASTSFLLASVAIPAVCKVMNKMPQLRSHFLAVSPDEFTKAGLAGAYHLAIHPTAYDWPRSWQTEIIGQISWGLFARAANPLIKGKTPIAEMPFVYPLQWDGARLSPQNDYCPLPLSERRTHVGTQTAEQAIQIVLHSDIVGFLPRIMAHEYVARKILQEVKVPRWPSVEQPVYLSIRTDAVSQAVFKAVRSAARGILKG
jgi:DNA-binding transcriptional LysR family regulator